MANWGDALSDDESAASGGHDWSEVFAEAEEPRAEWSEVFGASQPDGTPEDNGWGEVFGSQASSVGATQEDAELGEEALVPAAAGELTLQVSSAVPPPLSALLQDVRLQLVHSSGDAFGIGRCAAKVGSLEGDTCYKGRPLFNPVGYGIGLALARARRVQTLEMIAAEAGCKAHSEVSEAKSLMGAAIVHIERAALAMALDTLSSSVMGVGGQCVLLSLRHRYDETPLRARLPGQAAEPPAPNATPTVAGTMLPSTTGSTATLAKIVQHEISGGALFCLNGKYEMITFNLPVWLGNVDRTTAENYKQMASQVSLQLGRLSDRFQRVQRLSTTDGDAAVGKAERAIAAEDPRQHCLHTTCEVHRVSLLARKVGDLMSADVTGMVNLALSLGTAASMRSFRRVLRDIVVQQLRLRPALPEPAAERHRQALLDLFCPVQLGRGSSVIKRRMIEALANGDWSREGCIEHVCRGCCTGASDTQNKMASILCNMLARSACPIFPRSRWTRVDQTLCWLGMLWSVHRLLPAVLTEWASRLGLRGRLATAAGPADDAPPIADAMPQGDADGLHWRDGEAEGGAADPADVIRRNL